MSERSPRVILLAIALLCAPAHSAAVVSERTVDEVEQDVLKISAIRAMDDLSRELWPNWKISDTAFALYDQEGGQCVLVNHPHPPSNFDGFRTSGRSREPYSVGHDVRLSPEAGMLNNVVTAFVEWDRLDNEAVPSAFEEAFRSHLRGECADLSRLSPPVDGYPLTPENLALSDIECELLMRASQAPDDSLAYRTREFMALRAYRRLRLGSPAAEAYEKRLERLCGMSAYVGARARAEALHHLRGASADMLASCLGEPFDASACMAGPRDLDWYRRDRYRATGSLLCGVLDRFHPSWREEAGQCPDPSEVLWELTRTEVPRALGILIRFDLRGRVEERASFIEGLKSDAERAFDEIVNGEGRKLVVNTGLLASSSVSYDPENVIRVDDMRFVHERVLKIEFSGGTRVHANGIPIATNVGQDEFDIEQLTLKAPEELDVRVGGVAVELTLGVHEFNEPLSVMAQGLLVEARSGVIMVAEDKITFMLHR